MNTHTGNQMICARNPCHPEKGDFVRFLLVSTTAAIIKVAPESISPITLVVTTGKELLDEYQYISFSTIPST